MPIVIFSFDKNNEEDDALPLPLLSRTRITKILPDFTPGISRWTLLNFTWTGIAKKTVVAGNIQNTMPITCCLYPTFLKSSRISQTNMTRLGNSGIGFSDTLSQNQDPCFRKHGLLSQEVLGSPAATWYFARENSSSMNFALGEYEITSSEISIDFKGLSMTQRDDDVTGNITRFDAYFSYE